MGTKVAVAGATGFVGKRLLPRLAEEHAVVALGRRVRPSSEPGDGPGLHWRRCDLFSLRETEQALEGVDVAVYLVHSMQPSARLTQARFEDVDLLLADNFARAAAAQGVRRIVYLGGLVPSGEALSTHLASRLEVEEALGGHGTPVTAVRAGLIVGAGGSSLHILTRLVGRLPVMICPSWTSNPSQPIALDDVVRILQRCVDDEETTGRVCEVGGPDVFTYREMMRETARALNKRRLMLPVPVFSPGLSRLWVSLVTGSPKALVAPLIQSLRHPMVADDRWLQERMQLPGEPFPSALRRALASEGRVREPTVRSIQRLPRPAGVDAEWVADEYLSWLPRFLRPFLRAERDGDVCRLGLVGSRRTGMRLAFDRERSSESRAVLRVTGGALADLREPDERQRPRLEFRIAPDGRHVLAAVQDFRPRLPWWIYVATQAQLHAFVMW
ncbi:MAG: NAD(P)H-binding protein, partial [Myxococcota bacterium]